MTAEELRAENEALAELIREKLGVGGRGLAGRARRAGRLLPRRIRRQVDYLLEAETLAQNPKLARMVDDARARTAHAACAQFLDGIDPGERRAKYWLGILGSVAFSILAVAGLAVGVLMWRGYL